ncbi:hypothetical protein WT39_01625 [Burkholderia territorii]|nr:hypothetical protein WT39_01625 [Burkholderia territorii]
MLLFVFVEVVERDAGLAAAPRRATSPADGRDFDRGRRSVAMPTAMLAHARSIVSPRPRAAHAKKPALECGPFGTALRAAWRPRGEWLA